MEMKNLSTEVPLVLVTSLDELAKRTGRKKNLIIGASLEAFLQSDPDRQEEIIKRYLNTRQQ